MGQALPAADLPGLPTPAAAAAELLARRRARASLYDFSVYTMPGWIHGQHLREACALLERVEAGAVRRAMLNFPPRHAKSETTSKRFPAWSMGRRPKRQIIATSYSAELATDFGRAVRNLMRDQYYRNVFPDVQLAEDSTAAGRWHTNHGGIYIAAGIGGAITGRGADLLLVDDPFKNREEADSELMQARVFDWYMSTAFTRLMPGGSEVLIMTRWNERDLAGRLLAEHGVYSAENPDGWVVLELPAIANEDTEDERALWPERYDLEALRRIKRTIPLRDWVSLYRQKPRAEEGTYIKREWFADRYDQPPKHLRVYGFSDTAVREPEGDNDPDFTEHAIMGVDHQGDMWVLDWWYGQTTPDKWVEAEIELMAKWKPAAWFGEGGPIRRATEPFLVRRMRELKVVCRLEWINSVTDKAARGRAFQGMASMRRWHWPRTPWAERAINICVGFPGARHDDAFDVCSLAGQALDQQHPAFVDTPEQRAQRRRSEYGDEKAANPPSWKVL